MIKLEHVSKAYSAGIPALNDVNLNIEEGEFVFVVGDSGSGKSTLIKLLLKELEPTEGTITINGRKLNKIKRRQIPKFRRNIGVVFQDFRLLKDRNIYDNVAFAQKVIGESNRSIKKNVPLMLSMVGLAAKYRSYPKQLSGGEQQRVAIARALINRPKILLADEPTGNLDNNNAWEIMKLMEEINNNGTTVVVVTHNLEIVKAMNKRVVTMKKGVIVRHLLLPNHLEDSKKIIKYLHDTYDEDIYISIMNQYTPIKKFDKYPELNRTLTDKEYDELVNYACDLNITQAFIQEGETCKESFIPDFTNYDEI